MGGWEIVKNKLRSDSGMWILLIFCHFCLVNFISQFAMTHYPNTGDEFSILFQAKIFSLFKLSAEAPPIPEVFNSHYLEIHQGKWFGQYPPFFSLMITPGVWIGYPLFIISIFSSLSLAVLCVLLKKVLPAGSGRIITVFLILFGFSPLFIFHSASFYNHTGALLIYALILYNYMSYFENQRTKNLFWISFLFGVGVGIRPFTFFLLSFPLAVGLVKTRILKKGWRKLSALTLPFCVILALLFLYNYDQSGSWGKISYLKAGDNASKLSLNHFNDASFVRIFGMINETFKWIFSFGYFETGKLNSKTQNDLNLGLIFFLPILAFLMKKSLSKKHGQDSYRHFCKISFFSVLLLIAGHLFYDYRGGRFGERFFFEITWMLVLFFILMIDEFFARSKKTLPGLLIILTPCLIFYIPKTILSYRELNLQRMDVFLKTKELKNAVIHVGAVPSFDSAFYVRNHPELKGLIFVSLNRRFIWDVLNKYPKKEHYLYSYNSEDMSSKLILLEK